MLNDVILEQILSRLSRLRIGVVGDMFLDRYLDIDSGLTEPSIETALDAYQVVGVRSYPGAAGTIINNLVALGVGRVSVLSVIGRDGEGFELRRELERRQVDLRHLVETIERRTPTYTKPMLQAPGHPARELNRLDIKNRTPLPSTLEGVIIARLPGLLAEVEALLVVDQVSEPECGVITTRVRQCLATLGPAVDKLILVDSRRRISRFRNVSLKPNQGECRDAAQEEDLAACVWKLARFCAERPVFCTCGDQGILLATPDTPPGTVSRVPGYPVAGPIDPVGAGDSTSAGIACAYAAGASLAEAAAFGNLVASITIQQLGTTGTATAEQVRERWREINTRS
jgi:rfaE bifunctional protein kinase chain/domain